MPFSPEYARSLAISRRSMKAAHEKYGEAFVTAHDLFRTFDADSPEDMVNRFALWNDVENRGENIMNWYRQRSDART